MLPCVHSLHPSNHPVSINLKRKILKQNAKSFTAARTRAAPWLVCTRAARIVRRTYPLR